MSDQLRYTSEDDMKSLYMEDTGKFVKALVTNTVLMSATIDKDVNGKASKAELDTLLTTYGVDKQKYCNMFKGEADVKQFDQLLADIKAAAQTQDDQLMARATAGIEKITLDKLPGFIKFFGGGPDTGEYRPYVEAALKDPAIIAASKNMVIAHDDNLLDVCKLPEEEQRRPRIKQREK